MESPLNSFASMNMLYIAPQPPEVSSTLTVVAPGKFSHKILRISFSEGGDSVALVP